jgi:hypothetical protein
VVVKATTKHGSTEQRFVALGCVGGCRISGGSVNRAKRGVKWPLWFLPSNS